ncbi:MAG: hypothetical protein II633_05135 [Bacteroidales bacterium]|nr:hypothetical protein [Bacteroidales bacterium]
MRKISLFSILFLLLCSTTVWGQQDEAQEVIRVWRTRDKAIELRTRLSIDFNDLVAVEQLAQLYYYDFLDMNGGVKLADADRWEPDDSGRYHFPALEPAFDHCADSALWYLLHLWSRNPETYDYLYYPIVQVENYLQLPHAAYILPPEEYHKGAFFPDTYFISFSMYDWEHNYTIDLFQGTKQSRECSKSMARLLADMDEKDLYSATVAKREEVFRLLVHGLSFCQLYLVEAQGENTTLYYKEAQMNPQRSIDGTFHYSVTKRKQKNLAESQWQELSQLLDSISLEELPHFTTCLNRAEGQNYLYETLRPIGFQACHTGCPQPTQRRLLALLQRLVGKIR